MGNSSLAAYKIHTLMRDIPGIADTVTPTCSPALLETPHSANSGCDQPMSKRVSQSSPVLEYNCPARSILVSAILSPAFPLFDPTVFLLDSCSYVRVRFLCSRRFLPWRRPTTALIRCRLSSTLHRRDSIRTLSLAPAFHHTLKNYLFVRPWFEIQ